MFPLCCQHSFQENRVTYAERLDFLSRYDDVDVRADMASCYECKRCGALVRDTDLHDIWHDPITATLKSFNPDGRADG